MKKVVESYGELTSIQAVCSGLLVHNVWMNTLLDAALSLNKSYSHIWCYKASEFYFNYSMLLKAVLPNAEGI